MPIHIRGVRLALVSAILVGALPAAAQLARIGRLPLLVPLRSGRFGCKTIQPSAQLQKRGVARTLTVLDTAARRSITLGVTEAKQPHMLMAMVRDETGQRTESETVSVFFTPDGRVKSGTRLALTGGTPAVRSEDRRAGLLPADTAAAVALAKAMMKACGG